MSTDCLARVAGRAFNTTAEAFTKFTGRQGPHTLLDFYRFALTHGCICGLRLIEPEIQNGKIPRGEYDTAESDALVIVETRRHGWRHALYFHKLSGNFIDSNEGKDTTVSIGQYRILEWVPITRI